MSQRLRRPGTWMRGVLALAIVAPSLVPRVVYAEPTDADRRLAEALFRDGRRLLTEDHVTEACAKFGESQRLAPAIGTLLNLATCHEREGKLATAWSEFSTVATQAARAGDTDRETFARDHVRALDPKLATIVIVAPDAPAGMVMRLDGTELGTGVLGSALPVDPGPHTLEASAPHKKSWSASVVIPPKPVTASVQIPHFVDEAPPEIAPTAAPVASAIAPIAASTTQTSPLPPVVDHGDGSSERAAAYAALTIGAVGFGLGSVLGIYTFAKKGDVHCMSGKVGCTGQGDLDDAKSAATWSTITFGVGLVGVITGTVLLLDAAPTKPAPAHARVDVYPVASPTGGGLVIGGVF